MTKRLFDYSFILDIPPFDLDNNLDPNDGFHGIPFEVLALICQHDEKLWRFFAQYYLGFYNYTKDNASTYVKLFTIENIDWEGSETWSLFGKLHRGNDLPAFINGNEQGWYYNGVNHRSTKDANGRVLPAYVSVICREWRINGELHRDDLDDNDKLLPAKYTSNEKHYYDNGRLNRSDCEHLNCQCNHDGPAYVKYYDADGDDVDDIWGCSDLNNVNICLQKPLIPIFNKKSIWYQRGDLHRYETEPNGMPLPAYAYGDKLKWYYHGKLHMDHKDTNGKTLPAITSPNKTAYYNHGKLHRIDCAHRNCNCGDTLPAYHGDKYCKLTGDMELTSIWAIHGEYHRNDDKPAYFIDGILSKWYYYGKKHREFDRPAVIKVGISDSWYYYGKKHRDNDQPAFIQYERQDEDNLLVDMQKWYHHGQLWRESDKPCIVSNDGLQEWYSQGKLHRNEHPARIYSDGTREWWQNGVQHRNATINYNFSINIPAPTVEHPNGTKEWHNAGVLQTNDVFATIYRDGRLTFTQPTL